MDSEYVRMVCLERENQALRDQIRDLQSLLQVKDSEISLKYHLIQAKERENSQARSRLQWLEAAVKSAADAEAVRIAASTFDRGLLLKYKDAADGATERPAELGQYSMCAAPAGTLEVPPSPSKGGPKTPTKRGKDDDASVEGLYLPCATPSPEQHMVRGRGRETLVWQRKKSSKEDEQAESVAESAAQQALASEEPASPGSDGSSSSRRQPPALDLDNDDPVPLTIPAVEVHPPPGVPAVVAEAARDLPGPPAPPGPPPGSPGSGRAPDPGAARRPEEPQPNATPSKRLAIVDPSSGKHIQISPAAEPSRTKPTLISLEGPSAPPLTLPPVVAGAPPLSTQPLRGPTPPAYPGYPQPAGLGAGLLVPPGPLPPFGPTPGPGWLPPGTIGASPWDCPASRPPFPPPAHAPAVDVPGLPPLNPWGQQPDTGNEPLPPALQRLADALGGGSGGLMQMARGPLAAVPLTPDPSALGACGAIGGGRPSEPPPPPPTAVDALGLPTGLPSLDLAAAGMGWPPPIDAQLSATLPAALSSPLPSPLPCGPEQGIAERLADALGGGGGGLVQMARGPLAADPAACGTIGRPSEPPPPPPGSGASATGQGTAPGPIGPSPLASVTAVPLSTLGPMPLQPPGTLGSAVPPLQVAPGPPPSTTGSLVSPPLELFPPSSPPGPAFGPPPVGPPPPAPPGVPPGSGAQCLLGFAGYYPSPPPPPPGAPGAVAGPDSNDAPLGSPASQQARGWGASESLLLD